LLGQDGQRPAVQQRGDQAELAVRADEDARRPHDAVRREGVDGVEAKQLREVRIERSLQRWRDRRIGHHDHVGDRSANWIAELASSLVAEQVTGDVQVVAAPHVQAQERSGEVGG